GAPRRARFRRREACPWLIARSWLACAPVADASDTAPDGTPLPRHVDKPWGHENIWAWTDKYVGKLLVIETARRLSLQHHEHKDEWIHVLEGRLLLALENDDGAIEERELGPGESTRVRVGRRHRYT